MIIGREHEIKELMRAYDSEYSEFVAVYGRRRVGKTFLVRETFDYKFTFQYSGVHNESYKIQLRNFRDALKLSGMKKAHIPTDWSDAFFQLGELISQSPKGKKVIFIDEMPWLDTPRSNFISALEYFWNSFASARKDVLLIICGSATSWIINKILKNHGGLHNRVTFRIHLQPFTLRECELYAKSIGIRASRYDIIEYYMVLGGVAFYWSKLNKSMSLAQNIDNLIFNKSGFLHNEFNELYDSLFSEPESYLKVIGALGTIRAGMTRSELIEEGQITSNGKLTRILEDLEECGFVKELPTLGKNKNGNVICLIDNFTLFYYKFIKKNSANDEHFWTNSYNTATRLSWVGLAFERVCFHHIPQIKNALGISGVSTQYCAWRKMGKGDEKGAQIDLILDRADNIVNICEAKFSKSEFVIDKDYSEKLDNKIEQFARCSGSEKSIHLTMISVSGVSHNEYWNQVQSEVVASDLFS